MDSTSAEPGSKKSVIVMRRRPCHLALTNPLATPERLSAYLELVDRPLAALLARDRLHRLESTRYLYSARPIQLLQYQLVPSIEIRATYHRNSLQLLSENCRIAGLGRWDRLLTFGVSADLRPGSAALDGLATVWVALPATAPGWGRSLAARALEQALDRMERRLNRGLVKDLQAWLR
ncbi:MAG: DUF1997 domain-containing protein [Cyanobium sp.]